MWNFPNSRHVRNTSKNLTESRSNAREEQMASNSLANKIRNGKAAPMPCECRTTVFVMFMRRVYFEIAFDVFCFFPLVPHQWNILIIFYYLFTCSVSHSAFPFWFCIPMRPTHTMDKNKKVKKKHSNTHTHETKRMKSAQNQFLAEFKIHSHRTMFHTWWTLTFTPKLTNTHRAGLVHFCFVA